MKKISIICLIIIFLNIIFLNINKASAAGISDIISSGDSFVMEGLQNSKLDQAKLKSTSDFIYNILISLATVIAVITASILGIKFMLGSIEEKAKIKEAIIPFIIGCVVIFGAFGIWKISVQLLKDVNGSGSSVDLNNDSTARGNQAAERWIEKNLTGNKEEDKKLLDKQINEIKEAYDSERTNGELAAQLKYYEDYYDKNYK